MSITTRPWKRWVAETPKSDWTSSCVLTGEGIVVNQKALPAVSIGTSLMLTVILTVARGWFCCIESILLDQLKAQI